MSERCNCCRKWEEHIHLNGLTRQKFHFFKVLLGDFSHQLSIPRKFVSLFHEKLPETVDLKDPLGKRWHVKLKKAEGSIFLEDGWEEFVRDHSLEVGDFLVFRFSGDSCFKVLTFDASGCEKKSLYSCEKQKKRHACDENPVMEVGREYCVTLQPVPFPTRADGFDNVQAPQPQTIVLESADCPEMVSRVVKEETDSLNDELEVPPEQVIHRWVLRPRKRMISPDEQDSSTYRKRKFRNGRLATGVDYTTNESMKADPEETANSFRQCKHVKTYPRRSKSNRRPVTEEEKKRVFQLACAATLCHPAFISIMKPTHVSKYGYLTVPIAFASEFFSGHSGRITLHTAAGKWGVYGVAYGMNYRICHGWKEFVTGNNLREGDVLILEFASWRSHEDMNVRIFRVVEDAVDAAKGGRRPPP